MKRTAESDAYELGRFLVSRPQFAAYPLDFPPAMRAWTTQERASALALLREQGLAEPGATPFRLTTDGARYFGHAVAGERREVLTDALGILPDQHQSFVRLMLSAIAGRVLYLRAHPSESHLSFIAIGPTGAGKTVCGAIVCHLLGYPHHEHSTILRDRTPGDIRGRARQAKDGWTVTPSPLDSMLFYAFEEMDKAKPPVVLDVYSRFFHGGRTLTPLVTANYAAGASPYGNLLRPEYVRRSIVWDLHTIDPDIEETISRFMADVPAHIVNLDTLEAVADVLSAEATALIAATRELLTSDGRPEYSGVQYLRTAVLGHMAMFEVDEHAAVTRVLADYLTITATLADRVLPDWRAGFRILVDAYGLDRVELVASVQTWKEVETQALEQRNRQSEIATTDADRLSERARIRAVIHCRQRIEDLRTIRSREHRSIAGDLLADWMLILHHLENPNGESAQSIVAGFNGAELDAETRGFLDAIERQEAERYVPPQLSMGVLSSESVETGNDLPPPHIVPLRASSPMIRTLMGSLVSRGSMSKPGSADGCDGCSSPTYMRIFNIGGRAHRSCDACIPRFSQLSQR